MSASLNHEKFSDFFGSCPVFDIPGRCFPVKTKYCNYIGKKNVNNPDYLGKVSSNIIFWTISHMPAVALLCIFFNHDKSFESIT